MSTFRLKQPMYAVGAIVGIVLGRQLPHAALAALFVGRQAPELVVRWRVGIYVYSIEAHQESRADVLHVAASLYRFYVGGRRQRRS